MVHSMAWQVSLAQLSPGRLGSSTPPHPRPIREVEGNETGGAGRDLRAMGGHGRRWEAGVGGLWSDPGLRLRWRVGPELEG